MDSKEVECNISRQVLRRKFLSNMIHTITIYYIYIMYVYYYYAYYVLFSLVEILSMAAWMSCSVYVLVMSAVA